MSAVEITVVAMGSNWRRPIVGDRIVNFGNRFLHLNTWWTFIFTGVSITWWLEGFRVTCRRDQFATVIICRLETALWQGLRYLCYLDYLTFALWINDHLSTEVLAAIFTLTIALLVGIIARRCRRRKGIRCGCTNGGGGGRCCSCRGLGPCGTIRRSGGICVCWGHYCGTIRWNFIAWNFLPDLLFTFKTTAGISLSRCERQLAEEYRCQN